MLILILEVQSSQIRGSLVKRGEDGAQHIYFSERISVPFKQTAPSTYYVSMIMRALGDMTTMSMRALHSLASDQRNSVGNKIDEVHYVLSSPWIVSQARTVYMSFPEQTRIDAGRINTILDDERNKLKLRDSGPVETIEEKIFDVRLNGYSIPEWRGKDSHDLQISYAISIGSRSSIKNMRELAGQIVGDRHVFFHSSLLLQYIALRYELEPNRDDYTLIHIHGELTDVVLVRNGLCAFFGSFPTGVNTIVRKIAHHANIDNRTADSLFTLYLGGKLDDAHAQQTTIIMNDVSRYWTDELGKILKSGGLTESLPETAFVLSRSHQDFFTKSLATFAQKIRIDGLSADMVEIYALAIHRVEK